MCQEHRELAAVAVAAGQAAPGQSAASVSAGRGVTGPYWFVRLGDDKNCAWLNGRLFSAHTPGFCFYVLKPTFDRTEYAILVQGVTPALPCFVG